MDATEQAMAKHAERADFFAFVVRLRESAFDCRANAGELKHHPAMAIDKALGGVERAVPDAKGVDVEQRIDQMANSARGFGRSQTPALGSHECIERDDPIGVPGIIGEDNPSVITPLKMVYAQHVRIGRSLQALENVLQSRRGLVVAANDVDDMARMTCLTKREPPLTDRRWCEIAHHSQRPHPFGRWRRRPGRPGGGV